MSEAVNEAASVISIFNAQTKQFFPWRLKWQDRIYTTREIGYHHTHQSGSTLYHIYSIVTDSLFVRLSLNTSDLIWTIEEIQDKESGA